MKDCYGWELSTYGLLLTLELRNAHTREEIDEVLRKFNELKEKVDGKDKNLFDEEQSNHFGKF